MPLTDNIQANDTLVVRYVGGSIGDIALIVNIMWAYGPEDTISLPDVMKLETGEKVLFFCRQKEDHLQLLTYIPFPADGTKEVDKPDGNDYLQLSENQPSTSVDEEDGYGFAWDGYHRYWNDLPINYYSDIDGTSDIAGTSEFDAIRAAFTAWEDLRFSGIDFTDMGTCNVASAQYDGYNALLWITNYNETWVALNHNYVSNFHILESDTEFNDRYAWAVGAQQNCYDVQSVATHEIGHWLMLMDMQSNSQTMYGHMATNDVSPRSLEWGDENGAHYVYPVHNDANQGGDGSNTFSGASSVIKNTLYYGRLCDLPTPDHTLDTEDYFKIYTGSTARLAFVLHPPSNADFDLELYNPSGQLVAYSRTRANGGSETITRDPMGITGEWRIRIYRYSTGGQGGNGQYSFKISDIPLLK